ncbi:unnamed protein product [Ostreobium quekettii]|uniref:Protein kinase domain-containing protein n=1 Tax=Ostreobium quekettii TaxID=121088 RepID=A0A8S1JBM3_9CHLO|nr:unnamed protein product [Ostreobium quekettii]
MSSRGASRRSSLPPSPRSEDRHARGHRPTPESHGSPPSERPNKKQRTGQSHDENVDDQRLLRASREISRPGRLPMTDHRALVFPDRPSPPYRPPDEDGYYVCELGDNLSSRYKVLARIGEGSFGRVLECWDRETKKYVAIKVIRNISKYRDAAMIELEVLNTLQANDPEGKRHCVGIREWFDYRGHVCMVFERLGPSLYDFLRRSDYHPFPIPVVQQFGRLLLEAVAYMHEIKLIHTDLKPENILLERDGVEKVGSTPATRDRCLQDRRDTRTPSKVPSSRRLFVIDFGSATFDDQYHSALVSTRHYRAPEVILGLGWSYPCDMWSLGCILVELATGDTLFQTHDNLEHLAMMEKVRFQCVWGCLKPGNSFHVDFL